MKLNNETKIALLAIVAVGLAIWGFKFLKGIDIFSASQTFYVRYENVDQLTSSSPVFIKGLQVGTVRDLYIDKADDKTIIAVLDIQPGVDIPKDALATIVGQSLMGGKAVEITITHPCEGKDCAESGSYLQGSFRSFLQSIVGEPGEIDAYTDRLRKGLTINLDSLAKANPNGPAASLEALDHSLRNLEVMTNRINQLLASSSSGISATANNAAEITRGLRDSNKDISAMIANLSEVSAQLKNADLTKSTQKAVATLDSVTLSLTALRGTLSTTERTISRVDTLAQNLVRGEGLVGKSLTDEALYDNLVRTTRHMNLLMQDLRLNPKRYTTVKLKIFGKNKTKGYANPIDDPAYQILLDSLERDYDRKIKQE
ncbi:MAG: MCE family protein [Saprospiraceae bacterium]|nr:MCE family protein [Saprospiraceae bacterium]